MTEPHTVPAHGGLFPSTRHSLVDAVQGDDPQRRLAALDAIASVYWKPVYKYVRVRWSHAREDAEDVTQEFFARLVEKDFLGGFDPAKGRLRVYLRTCVDRLIANRHRDAQRQKRAPEAGLVALDFDAAEHEIARVPADPAQSPDQFFEQEWVRSVFSSSVKQFRLRCEQIGKQKQFAIFERCDLNDEDKKRSYDELASEFGLKTTDVTNYLSWARREFRTTVLDQIRAMTGSEEEFRREARALLGARFE